MERHLTYVLLIVKLLTRRQPWELTKVLQCSLEARTKTTSMLTTMGGVCKKGSTWLQSGPAFARAPHCVTERGSELD